MDIRFRHLNISDEKNYISGIALCYNTMKEANVLFDVLVEGFEANLSKKISIKMVHMNIPFSDIRRKIYRTIGLISIVLLVINIFYPLVFSVSDGMYQRGSAYIIFLIFAVFYIWDSLYLYAKRVKKMAV